MGFFNYLDFNISESFRGCGIGNLSCNSPWKNQYDAVIQVLVLTTTSFHWFWIIGTKESLIISVGKSDFMNQNVFNGFAQYPSDWIFLSRAL